MTSFVVKAHGEENFGIQALVLALERLNNVSVEILASPIPAA